MRRSARPRAGCSSRSTAHAGVSAAVRPLIAAYVAAGAEVIAVHVFEPHTVPMFLDGVPDEIAWRDEFLSQHCADLGIRLETRPGPTVLALLDVAAAEDVDVIALGWRQNLAARARGRRAGGAPAGAAPRGARPATAARAAAERTRHPDGATRSGPCHRVRNARKACSHWLMSGCSCPSGTWATTSAANSCPSR